MFGHISSDDQSWQNFQESGAKLVLGDLNEARLLDTQKFSNESSEAGFPFSPSTFLPVTFPTRKCGEVTLGDSQIHSNKHPETTFPFSLSLSPSLFAPVIMSNKKCAELNCPKRPTFNVPGLTQGKFCVVHKTDEMVAIRRKKCEHQGCEVAPSFNFEGHKKKYCFMHKLKGMIHLGHRICAYPGCNTRPCFNFEDQISGKFCVLHKLENMIDVQNKTCEFVGCSKKAYYKFKDEKRAQYCYLHKLTGMLCIAFSREERSIRRWHRTCTHPGCERIPSYDYKDKRGPKRASFCFEHKKEGMVEVETLVCRYDGCKKKGSFGYGGKHCSRYCSVHKLDGMKKVCTFTCDHITCTKKPFFNLNGEAKGRFCSEHKEEGMVNVKKPFPTQSNKKSFGMDWENGTRPHVRLFGSSKKHKKLREMFGNRKENAEPPAKKKCQQEGCQMFASFSFFDDTEKGYCINHKLEGMFHLFNGSCCKATCNRPSYFYLEIDTVMRYCFEHKTSDMMPITSLLPGTCRHPHCDHFPCFNYEGQKTGLYCELHRLKGMVDVKQQICKHTDCYNLTYNTLGGKSKNVYCLLHKFDNELRATTQKCEYLGCMEVPTFNFKDLKDGRFCSDHKLEKMVSIVPKTCEQEDCNKIARFNVKGKKQGVFCFTHKKNEMVNVHLKLCEHMNCEKTASFNFEGYEKRRFCFLHKQEGMIFLERKQWQHKNSNGIDNSIGFVCEHTACGSFASFNFESDTKTRLCEEHKLDGMIDNFQNNGNAPKFFSLKKEGEHFQGQNAGFKQFSRSRSNSQRGKKDFLYPPSKSNGRKLCEELGCVKEASFNYAGLKKRRMCSSHKLPGMLQVRRLCEDTACTKQATFNFPGVTLRRFCAAHKLQGMINVQRQYLKLPRAYDKPKTEQLPVVPEQKYIEQESYKVCEHINCHWNAVFNFPGESHGRLCQTHKFNGMVP